MNTLEEHMTQDEIIDMAEQAGMTQDGDMWFSFGKGDMDVEHKHLVAFAKLVAAHERKKFCALLRQFHDSISLASDSSQIRGQQ
jgi:hypothetical protein